MMEKKLHVFTFCTKSYVSMLNDYFLATLPKEIKDIKILYLNDMDDVRYSSATKFLEKRKLELLCEEIKACMGDNIFFIDGDVVFAHGTTFKHEINEMLEEYDLLFQFNDLWYNFGIFALNCNQNTLEYFEHLLNIEMPKAYNNSKLHDQHLGNALLGVFHPNAGIDISVDKSFKNLKHTALPIKYFGNHFANLKFPYDVPEDVVLFHATNTYNMAEKLSVLQLFKVIYYDTKKEEVKNE